MEKYILTDSDKKDIIKSMNGRCFVSFIVNDGLPLTLDSVDFNGDNVVLRSVYYMNGILSCVNEKMEMYNLEYVINDKDDVYTLIDIITDAPIDNKDDDDFMQELWD